MPPLSARIPGAAALTSTFTGALWSAPLRTTRATVPSGVPNGAWALIWVALTKSSGARIPPMLTDVPFSETGNGVAVALPSPAARFVPKIEISDPGAMEGSELKAFTTPPEATAGAGGGALAMAKPTACDISPPGLDTVMLARPAAATRFAGTTAVACAVLTKVVASAAPFHSTVDAGAKYPPFTVSVNAGAPSVTDAGLTPTATGVDGITVNVTGLVTSPLGLVRVIGNTPALTSRLAGTDALTCAASANVVATAVPFQRTTQLAAKLLPAMTIANAGPPAAAEAGVSERMAGRGGSIGRMTLLLSAPPGLRTVMLALVPARTPTRSAVTNAVTCTPLL